MAAIGSLALALAFAAAIFTVFAGTIGGQLQSRRWAYISQHGVYVSSALIITAASVMLYSFVTHDFSLPYVYGRSDSRMPLLYVVAAFWGGQEGSLLYWLTVTSAFAGVATWVNRNRLPLLMPWFHAVISGIYVVFLYVLNFVTHPFEVFTIIDAPVDGEGLNPLLQTPLMAIHPPCLLGGFASFAVPYAFGMAALLARDYGVDWLKATRRWTLISWLMLSVGNILGGMWAYRELGWGGYWAWDPVENAALIPWFAASAFLHSVIIQEQRGMLKRWNVILVSLTFLLTLLGTWMTRSGLIESVHTFAESDIGHYFLINLAVMTVFSIALIAFRWRSLKAENVIDSVVSREWAFLMNNWVLCALAFVVLWGTLYPKFSEMLTGEAIAISVPWFNRYVSPFGIALLALVGLGTLLPWRRTTWASVRRNFTLPLAMTLVGAPALIGLYWVVRARPLGVDPFGYAPALGIITVVLVIFNLSTIAVEFAKGTAARMRVTKSDALESLLSLFSRHRRRYGGYIVHIGMALIFLAFVGNVVKADRDATMRVGDEVQLGDYTVRFDAVRDEIARDKRELYADMTLTRNGQVVGVLHPARFDFNDYASLSEEGPSSMKVTSEIFIRSTPLEDVYVALLNYDPERGVAAFKLVVLPFTWWFWFGGLVLIAGTMICLWPDEEPIERRLMRQRAAAFGRGAFVVLFVFVPTWLGFASMSAWAQSPAPPSESVAVHLDDHDEQVAEEAFALIMTTCEGCAGKTLATASPSCYPSNQDKTRIRQMVSEGAALDDVLQAFVDERGASAVAIPTASSTRAVSWAVPFGLGVLGIGAVVAMGRRGVSNSAKVAASEAAAATAATAGAPAAADPYLSRLRDELDAGR
jgi:cytochrome c-type biogenesis protein CcmF